MNLKELEARLQTLVEIDLMNVLPGKKVEDIIIQKLAAAIQLNTIALDGGAYLAPNVYTLIVHPDAVKRWQEERLLDAILNSIAVAGQEAGLHFASAPTITIAAEAGTNLNDARVVASHKVGPIEETKSNPTESQGREKDFENQIPENAFLIVEGVKVFPLTVAVVNIGRRLDNQLVIDDPRVSRNHAQLRSIKGRYVVFDLNSTGGTFVNGQRTTQTVLYPGDVISLAGVALIFGQDNPPPRPDLKSTAPLESASSDRKTAFLKDRITGKFKKK